MKVSRAQAEENRRKVVESAGRLFREHGFGGVGLNELMSAAGLTHGGFYKQFKSKDELVREACACTLAGGTDTWKRIADGARAAPLDALVRHYLSTRHRDGIGDGCAFAALGPDAVRADASLRQRFEAALRDHGAILEHAMHATPDEALAAFSTMVGALLLSRMVDDDAYSRRILDAASARLLGAPSVPTPSATEPT